MSEAMELREWAALARKSIEPGFGRDELGRPLSAGACLHACLVVVLVLRRFGRGRPTVRGGSGNEGALDTAGVWRGHYWVEVQMPSGTHFVVDVTADQFGYDAIVVMPLDSASSRYRVGPQAEVDEAFAELVDEYDCLDMIAS